MREVLTLKKTHVLLVNCENERLLDKVRSLYRFKKTASACVEEVQTSGDSVEDSDLNSIIGPSTNRGKAEPKSGRATLIGFQIVYQMTGRVFD